MENRNFRYIDDWAAIRLADSFVKINKSGTGNGEASLYLGSKHDPNIFRFFGVEDFDVHCVMSKDDIIDFMNEVKCEYEINRYNYRNEVSIKTWDSFMSEIKTLPDLLYFDLKRKRQHDANGRVYAQEPTYRQPFDFDRNPKAATYDLIRRIAIPEVSFIMLFKLDDELASDFHARLFYDPNQE